MKKWFSFVLAVLLAVSLLGCGATPESAAKPEETPATEVTVTDMIGREVTIVPGSYTRVVCVGAGALRMYSYIGDVANLAGVEDIDNTSLAERPMMFDSVARPYVLAYGDVFSTLPSCGVGGPMAQAAEAEKILDCDPDIVISEFEDVEKEDALQQQLGVPVITLKGEAVWMEEEEAYTLSDDAFGQIALSAYKVGTAIKISEELLNDSVFDLPSYIAKEFARRIGTKEEEAFLIGDGKGKPTGIFAAAGLFVGVVGSWTSIRKFMNV